MRTDNSQIQKQSNIRSQSFTWSTEISTRKLWIDCISGVHLTTRKQYSDILCIDYRRKYHWICHSSSLILIQRTNLIASVAPAVNTTSNSSGEALHMANVNARASSSMSISSFPAALSHYNSKKLSIQRTIKLCSESFWIWEFIFIFMLPKFICLGTCGDLQ